jgi:hypothetical protein
MQDFVSRHRRAVNVGVIGAVGALFIVAGILAVNLLGGEAPLAVHPSGSGEPSASMPDETASPSLAASPSPEEPTTDSSQAVLAVALVDDLRIRDMAGLDGTPVASLNAGDVVWAETSDPVRADGSDWYQVWGGEDRAGWVSAGPADDPYLELRYSLPVALPATIEGVAAGDSGFIAWGREAHHSDREVGQVLLVSADGAAWERISAPVPARTASMDVAWGPQGWILVTSNETNTAAGTFWRSVDGRSWTALPSFDSSKIVPTGVAGSGPGYVLEVRDDRTGTSRATLLFSPDGAAWREVSMDRPADYFEQGVLATQQGFLSWLSNGDGTRFFESTDGITWIKAGDKLAEISNYTPQMAVIGNHAIAVLTRYDTGTQSIWRANLGDMDGGWQRMADAEATLAGTIISSLTSNSSVLVLKGYGTADGAPQLWRSSDGASWSQVADPGPFQGGAGLMDGRSHGFVAVGTEATAGALNPVLWHSATGEGWQPEASPVLGLVSTPLVGECPELPTTQVDWILLPGAVGVECFGDQPMTFRAWLTVAGGCGGFFPGTFEPAWLAGPYATAAFILSPYEAPDGGCGSAARHPDLVDPAEPQQWVIITGHYDDPAAATCRYRPDPAFPGTYVSAEQAIRMCQSRFVATSVVPE